MGINRKDFIDAIRKQYTGLSDSVASEYADMWLNKLSPQLYSSVNQWIRGEPIDDVCVGEFSIKGIIDIRSDGDYLKAMLLLSDYIADPRKGKALIMRPRR